MARKELVRQKIGAEKLGVSDIFIRRLLDSKKLTRYKLDSLTFIDLRELRALIQPESK
jgi:hypothetical protein